MWYNASISSEFVHFRKWHCQVKCGYICHIVLQGNMQLLETRFNICFSEVVTRFQKLAVATFQIPLIDQKFCLKGSDNFWHSLNNLFLRLQYDFQLYQGFQPLQQGHLKNSKVTNCENSDWIFPICFQFQEAHCHNDLGLKWLSFEVLQTYPRHEPRPLFFCSCSSRSERAFRIALISSSINWIWLSILSMACLAFCETEELL